jgi:hypothetical protein
LKPRVLISTGSFRIVQTGRRCNIIEKRIGVDAMNRVTWAMVPMDDLGEQGWCIIDLIGDALQRRNELARKARRARGGRP